MNSEKSQQKDRASQYWSGVYRNKYELADNLDDHDALVAPIEAFRNPSFCFVVTVLQGSMHMVVNGVEFDLHPNELVSIMPFSTVEIKSSRCVFFCHAVRAHLMYDIYNRIGIPVTVRNYSFCFHVRHFAPEHVARFRETYLAMKREMLRPDYYLKEFVLRAYLSIFMSNLYSVLHTSEAIKPYTETRQHQMFEHFLDDLDANYTVERSVQFYADNLGITPKYLTTLSLEFAGCPASVLIERYVVFRIKLMLYDETFNVKQISEHLHFTSQSFFGRYFKRVTGVSPREYVKLNGRSTVDYDDMPGYAHQAHDTEHHPSNDELFSVVESVVMPHHRALK